MKTKHQTKQHIVSRLVFFFAIMLLLCRATTAQQLEPNPNPVDNTITVSTSAGNYEYFDNWGTIEIWSCMLANWDTINNSGTIDNWYGTIDNQGTIDNSGTIDNWGIIDNWGTIYNSGTIDNLGTIEILLGTLANSGTTVNYDYIDNRDTFDNSGTLHNIGTFGNPGFFYNSGIFKGAGTFFGTLDTGTGTVAPGSSAGTMFVDGDYILDGTGTLEVEIGGFDAGESDLLDITGIASLTGGTINLSFVDGYDITSDIAPGESIPVVILQADSIDSFASVITYDFLGTPPGFVYEVYQDGNRLFFQATNTNSPPVVFVDADATGNNDGTSWDDAYNYLQDALAFAVAGDTIWVARGVYKPDQGAGIAPGDRNATFQLVNGVTLRGGYSGETILSGDLNGDDSGFTNNDENSYQVVNGGGTDASAVLDGFTITAGNANQVGPYVEYARGGGMYNEYGNPTVANCTFSGNWAYFGGGMCNYHSSPTVTDCTFSANQSEEGGGGGMCNITDSNPNVYNCTFSDNFAGDSGGGMWNYTYSSPELISCTFSSNSAHSGGGLCNYNYSSPVLTNCTFSRNSANFGGGMYNRYFSDPSMNNCVFSYNSAIEAGGAIYFWDSCTLTLRNSTFSENSVPRGYNDFADGATTFGEIETLGDQIVYIMDEPDPDGVRIATDSSGGATPARVGFCGSTTYLTFGAGADMVVNGCSIEIEVISGTIEIEFIAADGKVATTSLNAGNSLIAEQEILSITAPLTNSDIVVIVVDGEVYTLAPGESKTLVTIDIDPDTLNLKSKGKWITCYIELPEGLDVADIDVDTIMLNGHVPAQAHPTEIRDYDFDGVADLMVKFDSAATEETLEVGDEVPIIVTGELNDGTVFEGCDTIRVVD